MNRALVALLSLTASSLCGCLHPAEERAERDLEVGQASASGESVDVDDGLAAVRVLGPGELVLWAGAPAWAFSLSSDEAAGSSFEIEVDNAMPGAVLTVLEPTGLELTQLPADVPTRKRYRLALPGTALRARFAFARPGSEAAADFSFALLSDVQEALDDVGDVFARINAEPGIDFLLGAGDLTERGSREQLEQFQRELLALDIPYYTTLGNHELGRDPTLFHEYFGRGSFSFEYGGARFTAIDSASATIDPMVWDWLDSWLSRGRGGLHVVAMHIPPIDPIGVRNGCFASRAEASKMIGKLAEAGVDLTVYGHIHSYYEFENAGIPAFISGGGGAIPERFDNMGRHFMVFDVSGGAIASNRVVRVDP